MSDMINASSKSIFDLARSINDCLKKITSLNEELSYNMNRLKETFQDEGFDVVKGYVASSQARINEALPDLKLIMETLIEYGTLLDESEKIIR